MQNCCVSTVKHSPYVMIWGCISKYKTESLIMLQGMVNAEKYKEIIFSGLVPSIESITEREQEPIFQQDDSAPCHRARCVSGFVRLCQSANFFNQFQLFSNYRYPFWSQNWVESLDWPANSPDLNPIENVWALMSATKKKAKVKINAWIMVWGYNGGISGGFVWFHAQQDKNYIKIKILKFYLKFIDCLNK